MTSDDRRPIGDDDLQAFIDGRLDEDRRVAVEAYLAGHPEIAADIAEDIEIGMHLRARLSGIAADPVPSRLRVSHLLAARRRRMGERLRLAAAAIVLMLAGGTAGWFANDLSGEITGLRRTDVAQTATRDAIAAYRTFVVEKVHPVEVKADEEAHLNQWLSRRLGHAIPAPDLSAQGWTLMGGRLLPTTGDGPAAMFMYADTTGRRLTLYARSDDGGKPTGFHMDREADIGALGWSDHSLAYVVTARGDRGDLMGAAEAISRQLGSHTGDTL